MSGRATPHNSLRDMLLPAHRARRGELLTGDEPVLLRKDIYPSRSPSSWDRVTAWLREATPSLR